MIDQLIVLAVVSVLLLIVAGVMRAKKQRSFPPTKMAPLDGPDTVVGWPPQATRVLTDPERSAFELLQQALPGYMVLAQLPLSRFIKVPTRHSYTQWLRKVGNHCVDLVVADPLSQVIAVIEVRSLHAAEQSLRRHERVSRVLDSVGIPVHQWVEGGLPTLAQVQALFNLEPAKPSTAAPSQLAPAFAPALSDPIKTQGLSEAALEPTSGTFYIANEPLPYENSEAVPTQLEEYEPSLSMHPMALQSGVASLDSPPTTWYDEFDTLVEDQPQDRLNSSVSTQPPHPKRQAHKMPTL